MDMIISAESRSGIGKEAAKKVRAAGKIPAVFYGFEAESQPVSLDSKHLDKVLSNPKGINGYFNFNINGEDSGKRVLLRELQRHPVTRSILHIDIIAPDPKKEITATVPLKFVGRSVGVSTGGRPRTPYREVIVRALPENIPENIVVDITHVEQGEQIVASQLDVGSAEVIYDRDFVVFKVAAPRGGART